MKHFTLASTLTCQPGDHGFEFASGRHLKKKKQLTFFSRSHSLNWVLGKGPGKTKAAKVVLLHHPLGVSMPQALNGSFTISLFSGLVVIFVCAFLQISLHYKSNWIIPFSGKRSCQPGINRGDGWVIPLNIYIETEQFLPTDCSIFRNIGKHV